MRRLVAAVVVLALAGGLSASALAATRTVKIGDNFFVRDRAGTPTVTVRKGTKVRFRWVGDAPHNVQVQRGPARFKSKVKTAGTYTRTLRRTGTYRLVCIVHASEMKLTLRVR